MNRFKLFVFHVFLPLLTGTVIYLLLRCDSIILFKWFDSILLTKSIDYFRAFFLPYRSHIPSWVTYSLPDGLWGYALLSTLLIIWRNDFNILRIWICIAIFAGPFLELMQYKNYLPGTYDLIDIFTYLFFSSLSILVFKLKTDYHEK